ncbi:MAG: hypothetical protein QF752_13040 [Planctomycetota bacterium]|jgi:hypothetical protein|nr:hypothetical protein [Planctomycetota bacterium]
MTPDAQTKLWVEIIVEEPDGNDSYVGLVDEPLEDSIFSLAGDDFVKLEKVRWREEASELEFKVVKQSEMGGDYTDHFFVKKSKIVMIRPIKKESIIWGDRNGLHSRIMGTGSQESSNPHST